MKRMLIVLLMSANVSAGYVGYTVDWSTDLSSFVDTNRSAPLVRSILSDDTNDAKYILVCGIGIENAPLLILLDTQGSILTSLNMDVPLGSRLSGMLDSFAFVGQISENAFICYHTRSEQDPSATYYDYYGFEIDGTSLKFNRIDYGTQSYHFVSLGGILGLDTPLPPENRATRIVLTPSNRLEQQTFYISDSPAGTNETPRSSVVLSLHETDNLIGGDWKAIGFIEDNQPASNRFYRLEIED